MANALWNVPTSRPTVEQPIVTPVAAIKPVVVETQVAAEPAAVEVAEPVVVETPVAAPSWSSSWSRAQLMNYATNAGVAVTLSNSKAEIIQLLTTAGV